MSFEGFPLVVGWELTLWGNLRCGHCASSAGLPRNHELTLEESLDICDQFPPLLVREVDFTGGEPLLNHNWTRVANRLNTLQIPVRLVTNGLLLKECISDLKEVGIATVGVSLDGLEATHDHIRKHLGLFKHVTEGIETAVEAGIPIAVITAVNEINVGDLPGLLEVLQRLGVKHWQVQPTFSLGRARDGGVPNLSNASFLKLGEFVNNNVCQCKSGGLSIIPADGVGYYTYLDNRPQAWQGCSAGRASCGITSDGKIKGCLSFPDNLIEGDLRKRDLWSIWFDADSFAYNRCFSLGDLGVNCTGCEFGEQCMGGCGVMSYAATQQFHNNPYCFHRIISECR